MSILGPDPTPGTPFLRSDCDGRCANYQGGDFHRVRHVGGGGGGGQHHHHHHSHGHGHSHDAQKLNRAPSMGETAPRTSTPTVGEATVPRLDLPATPVPTGSDSTRNLTSNSISKRLLHVTKRNSHNQIDDGVASDITQSIATRTDISETDLARIRKALDLDDPKRTDYTYSFSQTYHQRPPTPRWENPRMCRPSLHGAHEDFHRSVSFDDSFAESTISRFSAFYAWLKSFFEETTTTTTETTEWSSSSPSSSPMANGGAKASLPKRVSSRTSSRLNEQQQKQAKTSLTNGRLSTGQRKADPFAFDDSASSSSASVVDVSTEKEFGHQFWLWRAFCTTIVTTVTTTFETLTYPARRLMLDAHERRRRGRGCAGFCCWWLPLLLLLLLLLPACLFMCQNDEYKERTRLFVDSRILPLPLALWHNSRDALVRSQNAAYGYWSGMDLSGLSWPAEKARGYWSEWWPIVIGWVSFSRSVPEDTRPQVVAPPVVVMKESDRGRESVIVLGAAEREELDQLRLTVDELRAEMAGFSRRCCKQPDLAAYLTRSDADQLLSDHSAKLAALGAELRLIDEKLTAGQKSSSSVIDRLEKNIAALGAELLALTNRLSSSDSQTAAIVLGLAATEQKLQQFRESQLEREKIVLEQAQKAAIAAATVTTATAGETQTHTIIQQQAFELPADVQAQLALLTGMTAQLAAFDKQLAYLRSRDEQHDAYGADIAQLRTELDQKMGGLSGEWRRDLTAAIGGLDLGKEELIALKARLETIELKSSESSHKVAVDLSVDLEEVKRLIGLAIARYDADKTGLADYALESAGGSIVSIRCSRTHSPKTRKESIFGIPLWYANYGPRTVIQRKAQGTIPGECWAFEGSVGFLVIQLSGDIDISAFSYEHISKAVSPDGHIESAPHLFEFWALKSEYDPEPFLLGSYSYDDNGEPLQMYPIQHKPPHPTSMVEMKIVKNHGHPQYTCLYRLRVHGKRVKPGYGVGP